MAEVLAFFGLSIAYFCALCTNIFQQNVQNRKYIKFQLTIL